MPLSKVILKPGVNRENTRYTNEGGWYESEKVRFRQGTPEKLGGWARISSNTFLGVCRSLWNWVTLASQNLLGVGTNLKFYIENGGAYYDITPIRQSTTLTDPFTTNEATNTGTTTLVTVTDANGGFANNDFVTYYINDAASVTFNGITIASNTQYQITILTDTTYTITVTGTALLSSTGGGSIYAVYQVNTGPSYTVPSTGWGASTWGSGAWGVGITTIDPLRIWNQNNWGQNLVYGPRGGPLYYWDAIIPLVTPATITIDNGSPALFTVTAAGVSFVENTPITLSTTGWLPTGVQPGVTYYVKPVTTTTFNLGASGGAASPLTNVIITGYNGEFSCDVTTLVSGLPVTVSGPDNSTIVGYVDPTTYYISYTNGSTIFTLVDATPSPISTTPGPTTGNTYTKGQAFINASGTQSGVQSVSTRGVLLSSLPGSDGYAPLYQNAFTVSDVSRFLIVFGTNDYGSTTLDPMLIRWSDQESLTVWFPAITNQAGSVRLSHGSEIITTLQSRQEILVWTDQALYSLQYLGPPYVWGTQLLVDNVSIASPNAAAVASGVTYWMGVDKFYKYDGRIQTLRCDLLRYVYSDINTLQYELIVAGTSEGFNEVWWFYCSQNSTVNNRYVIYNYTEDVWYYGSMGRTAWLDSGLRNYPIGATYSNNIVNHEYGVDDNETSTTLPIEASITSSQYDIGDGNNFAFVYRMLPDLTFRGSTSGTTPQVTMYLQGLNNSGSGITQSGNAGVAYSGSAPSVINVDEFTGQIYIRIRGRQMQMQITSNTIGTQWQLGAPRIDTRPDGRR